ncbi:MAG: DUF4892 domain-containing protein [Halioglobus sp.]|nr:DUF4892 domain-containing protein [Halioglobus sp.]
MAALAQEPDGAIRDLLVAADSSPHTEQIATSSADVVDHEIGLGAMRKVRGFWQFKDSARHDGRLTRYTWQVKDGFASAEVLNDLQANLLALQGASLLFHCDGRACGHANQWANRVFGQRLLYGKSDEQRYRVIAVENATGSARVLLYSSARTADRQYLHADYLKLIEE